MEKMTKLKNQLEFLKQRDKDTLILRCDLRDEIR
jgi:hypothetical protein